MFRKQIVENQAFLTVLRHLRECGGGESATNVRAPDAEKRMDWVELPLLPFALLDP